MTWAVERWRGTASQHHARPFPDSPERAVWVHAVARPAVILGSAQRPDILDTSLAEALGLEIVRRRSGGGVVLLVPGEVAWVDVILPAGDPLWVDDVSRAGLWLGEVWQTALAGMGLSRTKLHDGPLVCGPLGRLVCFGAVGPGEVTYEGRKVVGVSQRRTRTGARFQCAIYRQWAPTLLGHLLKLDEPQRRSLADAAMGTGIAPEPMVSAFLRHLQRV